MVTRTIFVCLALFVALTVQSQTREEQIAERLKPVGEVKLASASGAAGTQDPETVYNTFCVACHSGAVPGSPVLGDVAAWSERLAKGVDVLYESGINGIAGTLMPAKGTCVSCSEDDIKATVDYMLEKSQ